MTGRKLSISECTTYSASFTEDLAAYSAAGAAGIGIWEYKLPPGRDAEMIARLQDTPLVASLCIAAVPSPLPDPFFTDPVAPAERVKAMGEGIRRLAAFGPDCIVVLAGAPMVGEPDGGWQIAVDGLRAAAQVAADCGVRLALEPLRATSGTLIPSLDEAVRMLNEIGDEASGLIFDTWHFWDYPDIADVIRRHASRVAGVQVNDWRRETRSWCDRVLPGDGVMDYRPMLAALDESSYGGWFDLEVFSDDGRFGNDYTDSVWKRDVAEIAREGVARLRLL